MLKSDSEIINSSMCKGWFLLDTKLFEVSLNIIILKDKINKICLLPHQPTLLFVPAIWFPQRYTTAPENIVSAPCMFFAACRSIYDIGLDMNGRSFGGSIYISTYRYAPGFVRAAVAMPAVTL